MRVERCPHVSSAAAPGLGATCPCCGGKELLDASRAHDGPAFKGEPKAWLFAAYKYCSACGVGMFSSMAAAINMLGVRVSAQPRRKKRASASSTTKTLK